MSTSLPKYTLRINRVLLEKIKYIAERIKKHIEDYEQRKGEIKINIEE